MNRSLLVLAGVMKSMSAALLNASGKVVGLLLVFSLLPNSASAQCSHAPGRALDGDFDGFVPVSRPAANDAAKRQDREPSGPARTPAKPAPCHGCFHCGHSPASAPTSTLNSVEILDLLPQTATPVELDSGSEPAEYAPDLNRQYPVFTIKHPPRIGS